MAQIKEAMKMKNKKEEDKNEEEEKNVNNSLVEELMLPEDHKIGEVDFKVFVQFIRMNGGFLVYIPSLLFMILGLVTADVGADLIIQYWC